MKRYIEEIRRGKDIGTFLNRLVDSINDKAREIVEDEAGLFAMLGDALGELLTDFKKSSPDLITNIRALGGGRNREIIAQVQAGREKILILVKIMRHGQHDAHIQVAKFTLGAEFGHSLATQPDFSA